MNISHRLNQAVNLLFSFSTVCSLAAISSIERVDRIAKGLFLITSGVALTAKATLCSNRFSIKSRCILGGLGFTTALVGLTYFHAELFSSKKLQPISTCGEKIAHAEKQIANCTQAQDLWQRVKAEGRFTLACGDKPLENRQIFLHDDEPFSEQVVDRLSELLYEKAKQSLTEKECLMPKHYFVTLMQRSRYEDYLRSTQIINECWSERSRSPIFDFEEFARSIPVAETERLEKFFNSRCSNYLIHQAKAKEENHYYSP